MDLRELAEALVDSIGETLGVDTVGNVVETGQFEQAVQATLRALIPIASVVEPGLLEHCLDHVPRPVGHFPGREVEVRERAYHLHRLQPERADRPGGRALAYRGAVPTRHGSLGHPLHDRGNDLRVLVRDP